MTDAAVIAGPIRVQLAAAALNGLLSASGSYRRRETTGKALFPSAFFPTDRLVFSIKSFADLRIYTSASSELL